MASKPPEGRLEVPQGAKGSEASSEGLAGIFASDSEISLVDGVQGTLLYRGYDIRDLAEHATFEETAYLLWHGTLPKAGQLDDFTRDLARQRALSAEVLGLLKQVGGSASTIGALRSAVSLLGNLDPEAEETSESARRKVAGRLLAQVPTIVAAHARLSQGKEPVAPTAEGSMAHSFLHMLHGKQPSEQQARAMDVALILHADHEFNASTFAARVTTSTLSDIYSAITTAIGTLKGPLHGGANREVMRALETIGTSDKVETFVDAKLRAHEKIMGFGHRVYKTMDPRAAILKAWSERMGKEAGDTRWYDLSARMEQLVHQRKGLYPNVDFYAASLYHSLGVPRQVFPALFAVSRISGWLAHVLEQYGDNKLIRPLARYTGPRGLKYVPLASRE